MMKGKLYVENGKDGFTFLVFVVERKEDVNGLTLDMIGMGLDVLYEPQNISGRYESCVLCNETVGIKMIAYQE